jgi:hypothetical protein
LYPLGSQGNDPENCSKGVNNMKKTIFAMLALVLALGALGIGVAFAQTEEPPVDGFPYGFGHGAMHQAAGTMRVYKVEAFAAQLDLTVDEVNALLDGGTRLHQIALDNGVAEADLPAFMQEAHQAALDLAVADGALTQEQADFMNQHMQFRGQNGGMPCGNDGYGPQDASGFRGGGHGMMGGGRGGFMNQQP